MPAKETWLSASADQRQAPDNDEYTEQGRDEAD
jgi:hypothetical protein